MAEHVRRSGFDISLLRYVTDLDSIIEIKYVVTQSDDLYTFFPICQLSIQ